MKRLSISLVIVMGLISLSTYAQKKQRKMSSQIKSVTAFLDGFNDPSKIQESLAQLSEDYTFKNPMVSLNSKAEFIALAEEMGKIITGVKIVNVAENKDWVVVHYEFTSSVPGLESNFGTEWFRLEKGAIKESILFYDASEWRKVYAEMK